MSSNAQPWRLQNFFILIYTCYLFLRFAIVKNIFLSITDGSAILPKLAMPTGPETHEAEDADFIQPTPSIIMAWKAPEETDQRLRSIGWTSSRPWTKKANPPDALSLSTSNRPPAGSLIPNVSPLRPLKRGPNFPAVPKKQVQIQVEFSFTHYP